MIVSILTVSISLFSIVNTVLTIINCKNVKVSCQLLHMVSFNIIWLISYLHLNKKLSIILSPPGSSCSARRTIVVLWIFMLRGLFEPIFWTRWSFPISGRNSFSLKVPIQIHYLNHTSNCSLVVAPQNQPTIAPIWPKMARNC